MSEVRKLIVTLLWYNADERREQQLGCLDRSPQLLIPPLVQRLGLPQIDGEGGEIFYELRLDGEQRPPLRPKDLLSHQGVRDGSRLWLLPEGNRHASRLGRCILTLPDNSEIVVSPRGQGLTRSWLLECQRLHNPPAFEREMASMGEGQSPFRFVSDRRPHCTISPSERNYWVLATDRADVCTEWAGSRDDYEAITPGVQYRLENESRLRLGGGRGVEIGVTIL